MTHGGPEYPALLRAAPRPVWLGLLGIPLLLAGVFVLAPALMTVPFLLWYGASGVPAQETLARVTDLADPSPVSLAYLNLTLATAIPLSWLLVRALHGMRPRWLSSVHPRIRWRWFFVCLGLSVVALAVSIVVSTLLPGQEAGEVSQELNPFTRQVRDFLLVVLFLTPLQAAAEEYLFRGYLTQAVGSMADTAWGRTAGRVLAVAVPALLFALAHGSQSAPVFFDRFAFGVLSGVLVLITGGLEAGIAMHVLNNFVAFGLALAFSDLASALNPGEATWWMIPSTVIRTLLFLALVWSAARRMGVARSADPAVLAASTGLVYRSSSAPEDSSEGA